MYNRYYFFTNEHYNLSFMKQIFLFSFLLVGMFTFNSCEKEKTQNEAAENVTEAELRLSNVKRWIVTDAKINDIYILKDKILLDPDQDGIAEWLSFDTDAKTIEVKYPDEPETTFFDYTIENDVFKVTHKDGVEEVMYIQSGSVYVDQFTLLQTDGNYNAEYTLKVE
jgi:hypothetical protein